VGKDGLLASVKEWPIGDSRLLIFPISDPLHTLIAIAEIRVNRSLIE